MDDNDLATQQEELAREAALAFRKPEPEHTGHCMNCGEPIPPEVVYCDRDCLVDHERAVAARLRNGR